MPGQQTINELHQFLDITASALNWSMQDEGNELIVEEILGLLRLAWEAEILGQLNQSRNWLDIAGTDSSEGELRRLSLDANGFTDTQWAPKWVSFMIASQVFQAALEGLRGVSLQGVRGFVSSGVGIPRRAIALSMLPLSGKLLELIDGILDSLVKSIGPLEPLREFKTLVERSQ